jgi:pullulanase/glycogen debranching enzyme
MRPPPIRSAARSPLLRRRGAQLQRRLPAGVYDERPRLAFARPAGRSREAARKPGDNAATALKSVVVDPSTYGWAGDTPLGRPFAKTIIYE